MSGRIRVLYVLPSMEAGGAETQAVEHLRRLPRDRFALELALCQRTGLRLAEVPDDVPVHEIGAGFGPSKLPGRVLRLRRLLRARRPDLVVSMLWYADLVSLLAGGPVPRACYLRSDLPRVRPTLPWRQRLGLGWTLRLYGRAAALVAPPWIARPFGAVELEHGVAPEVLQRRARAAAAPSWPGPGLRILALGRLHPAKGFDVLLDAFAAARRRGLDASLVIAGEGDERAALEARAAGMDRVALPGFLPNPFPALAHADVFVLSSRVEGMANVVNEALVLGAPVIATPCAGEQLDGAGVVVPFEDPGAIADALLALAASSRRREELARRGRARAAAFSWTRVLPRMVALYESLARDPA